MSSTDQIIILGAGHNGLAAAAYLAKAGRRVVVLESRSTIGGIAATETLSPGFQFNTGFSNTASLLPAVVQDLGLKGHGLTTHKPKTALFAAWPGGGFALDGAGQVVAGASGIGADAARLPEFAAFLNRMTGVLAAMRPLTPPPLKGPWTLAELWPWAQVALKVKGLGEREMMEFVRVLPMSAAEFLGEWFESDPVRGAFALLSTSGAHLGPLGAGTTLNLLYQLLGGLAPEYAVGGAGAVSEALAQAVRAAGGEIRLDTPAAAILIENGRAVGVRTPAGDLTADRVVSSLTPAQTLRTLVGERHLPVRFVRRLNNIRYRGSTATVHYALDKLPDFGTAAENLDGWIALAPSIDYVERAYDDAKYGRISDRPALLLNIPTLTDPSLAPTGKHTLTAMVRYAPYDLKDGSWDALPGRVTAEITRCAPNFEKTIRSVHPITPHDYAHNFGLTEGAWMHGQLGLDQMLVMRPLPGWAQYRTPIKGLYLCGSGAHPGGGISAAPGMNAARAVLEDA